MKVGDGIEVVVLELNGLVVSERSRLAIVEIIDGDVIQAKLRKPLEDGTTHVKVHMCDRGQMWR